MKREQPHMEVSEGLEIFGQFAESLWIAEPVDLDALFHQDSNVLRSGRSVWMPAGTVEAQNTGFSRSFEC